MRSFHFLIRRGCPRAHAATRLALHPGGGSPLSRTFQGGAPVVAFPRAAVAESSLRPGLPYPGPLGLLESLPTAKGLVGASGADVAMPVVRSRDVIDESELAIQREGMAIADPRARIEASQLSIERERIVVAETMEVIVGTRAIIDETRPLIEESRDAFARTRAAVVRAGARVER